MFLARGSRIYSGTIQQQRLFRRDQALWALGVHGPRGKGVTASELAGGRAGGVGAGRGEEQLGAGCVTRQSPGGVPSQVLCAGAGSGCSSSGERPVPRAVGATAWGVWHQRNTEAEGGGQHSWVPTTSGKVEEAVGEDSGGSWKR